MKRLFTGAAFFLFFFMYAPLSGATGAGPQASGAFFSPVSIPSCEDGVTCADFYSLSFAADYTPWNVSAGFAPGTKTIVFMADNWWIYRRISDCLNYELFWGNWTSVCLDSDTEILTGPRLGIGMNLFLFPGRHIELVTAASWNPLFGIRKTTRWEGVFHPFVFPVSASLRFWVY